MIAARNRPRRMPALGVAVFVALLLTAVRASAQDPADAATGVVTRATPMFFLPDSNRTPMRTIPADTTVRVLSVVEDFYRIVYTDARFGDETGYVPIAQVQILTPFAARERQERRGGNGDWQFRGFMEGKGIFFAREAANDSTQAVGDGRLREEAFYKPNRWFQAAGGIDLRANSYDQVENAWRLDVADRRTLRPVASLRRGSVSLTTSRVTIDVGRQFIRWGRADILSPTDRFAPRDFINVLDTEFLPVFGGRAGLHVGSENVEFVVTRFTPSRLPVLTQRWTVLPPEAEGLTVLDGGPTYPDRSQRGLRWTHVGSFELGASYFDGFNHLPNLTPQVDLETGSLTIARSYPRLRTVGFEAAVPTRWFTLKGETAFYDSPDDLNDQYALFVVEIERQAGEWLLDLGYAGEAAGDPKGIVSFAAERGLARTVIGRASYTVDPRRTLAVEGALRQDGDGFYAKGEFSQAFGQNLRFTISAVGLGGDRRSFLGQFRDNSHIAASLRLSY